MWWILIVWEFRGKPNKCELRCAKDYTVKVGLELGYLGMHGLGEGICTLTHWDFGDH